MFKSLQQKWKVSGWRLLLILFTFAIGGSLTGLAGKKLMTVSGIEIHFCISPFILFWLALSGLLWC
jgi:hypothetical protein